MIENQNSYPMNLLVTLDRNYVPQLNVMLFSALQSDPAAFFDVYILHDEGLSASDLTATRALLGQRVALPRFGGALLPSLAYLTGAVLLVAVAGYAVDAVYQRLYRLLRLPALETKLDALTARILQSIVGSKET